MDEGFQTSVPSIYAVGDVINRIQLTPIALAEGHSLADTLFGGKPRKTDYSDVPTAVFSNPPIGSNLRYLLCPSLLFILFSEPACLRACQQHITYHGVICRGSVDILI